MKALLSWVGIAGVVVIVGRIRHAGRWRAAGASVTFALAAVAGVAGNELTGHLVPALVSFAVLLVVGMVITYLMQRSEGAQGFGEKKGADIADWEGGKYDMRGARGVQIGDHNRQLNYFDVEPGSDRRE